MDIEKMLEKCILCPRKCGVNRTNGSTDQVPYFFPVALLDAVSARTKIFPEAEQEKKYP